MTKSEESGIRQSREYYDENLRPGAGKSETTTKAPEELAEIEKKSIAASIAKTQAQQKVKKGLLR